MHTVDGTYQGIRTHILEIFSRLIPLCPNIHFYLFLENPTVLSDFSNNFNLPNVTTIRIPVANPLLRLLWFFPRMQRNLTLDYFHSQYIFPFPLFSKGLVTIHDILFETHPQFFPKFFRFRSKILIRYAAKISKHIFTVSNYSKDSIIKEYNIGGDKITVAYNAASNIFTNTNAQPSELEKFSLESRNYLLTVGRNDKRKNYQTLITAYAEISDNAPPLVIIDSSSKRFSLMKIIEKYNLQNSVRIISNINNKVLSEIYKNATLFIYPSHAEGFGIPVIESMASGLCAIISETSSLKELGDKAVFFINPDKPKELASSIIKLLANNELRQKHEDLSLRRASKFSWNDSADKIAKIYQTLK